MNVWCYLTIYLDNKFISAEQRALKDRRLSNLDTMKLNQYLLKQEEWQELHYHNVPGLESEQMKAQDSQNLGDQEPSLSVKVY